MDKLRIYNANWTSVNAGPSPDGNKRTEIFLAGCRMAQNGSPCKGCFNPGLWGDSAIAEEHPMDAALVIKKFAPNKFVTFVGGEPLDQLDALAETCEELKKYGFHIIVFTHYLYSEVMDMEQRAGVQLTRYVDILVDGKYEEAERIYDEDYDDGFRNTIGSGNQVVWDLRGIAPIGFAARDLVGIYVRPDLELIYITKDEKVQPVLWQQRAA